MKKIFGIIHFILYLIYMVIISIPKSKRLQKKGLVIENRIYTNKITKKVCDILIKATGSSIEVHGLENIPEDGAVLFVSNHQGYFDIPVLLVSIPKTLSFLAKIELKSWPIIGKWVDHIEGVYIDRQDIRQSLRAINSTAEKLKSGQSMVIFPEGTRSKSRELNPFKPGSLRAAQKANVPIIPITIDGTYKILEGSKKKLAPANVKLYIGKPIESNQKIEGSFKSKDLMPEIYNEIKNNLQKISHY
ncbi:MAG: 1-acyl-sn-glycerol-3-phosphate acyltransferase [Clostridiales bacterium]|nr:1-acyl-sn-glycerol-3-phosphate acyltransferase [Clostridiales bacterium]